MPTTQDLRHRVAVIEHLLNDHPNVREHLGIPEGFRLQFETGSKTYGRAFRLYYSSEGSTGHHTIHATVSSPSFLGMTKREAEETLMAFQRECHLINSLTS